MDSPSRLKILHLGKYYPPYKGGMETVLSSLCEAHAGRAEVTALVTHGQWRTVRETAAGVRIIRVGCVGTPFSVPITPTLPGWLRRIPTDVLVHHEPNPGALLSVLSVRPTAPLVIWFHSDIVRQRVFYGAYRPFLRRALQRACTIVVASPNHVRYTPLLREFEEKCCVIPYGVDLERFRISPEVEERFEAIRATSRLPIVLFTGRFSYYKGIEYLIEAMRRVRARLILVGGGPKAEEARRQAVALDTPGVIEFAGEVSDADLVPLLHACDVFVLPSVERSEAFGVVQLEAMACGKPVVSCRIPSGVPWVNQDGRTGLLVPPRDPGGLAEAINRLLEDPGLRASLGEKGRQRVAREFTLRQMQEAFWDVLIEAGKGNVAARYRYEASDDTDYQLSRKDA